MLGITLISLFICGCKDNANRKQNKIKKERILFFYWAHKSDKLHRLLDPTQAYR